MLGPTTDFADLCFHALAHVRLPPPGDLYDGAYVAWAKGALDADAVAPFAEDAATLSRICARSPERALALAALPILFDSIEAFRPAAREVRSAFGGLLSEGKRPPPLRRDSGSRRTSQLAELENAWFGPTTIEASANAPSPQRRPAERVSMLDFFMNIVGDILAAPTTYLLTFVALLGWLILRTTVFSRS